ncbi:MAG: hypothetical protein WCN95_15315, partial [bacterium]
MKATVAGLALLIATQTAMARPIRVWSHQELYTNSDLVAILTVESVTLSAAVSTNNPVPSLYKDYVAHCKVLQVLKGDPTITTVDMPFFQSPDGRPGFNGALPAPFTVQKTIDYLAYLKHDPEGGWVATAGTYDAGLSIKTIKFTFEARDLKLPT